MKSGTLFLHISSMQCFRKWFCSAGKLSPSACNIRANCSCSVCFTGFNRSAIYFHVCASGAEITIQKHCCWGEGIWSSHGKTRRGTAAAHTLTTEVWYHVINYWFYNRVFIKMHVLTTHAAMLWIYCSWLCPACIASWLPLRVLIVASLSLLSGHTNFLTLCVLREMLKCCPDASQQFLSNYSNTSNSRHKITVICLWLFRKLLIKTLGNRMNPREKVI